MAFALTIILQASALAGAKILALVDALSEVDPSQVQVKDLIPVRVQKPKRVLVPVRSAERTHEASAGKPRQAPGVPITNPFVVHAVENSATRRIRVQTPTVTRGRNRVIYILTNPVPEGATIVGVPRQVLDLIIAHPLGLCTKDVEFVSGLKRKSIESALYHLRTIGVIKSVEA